MDDNDNGNNKGANCNKNHSEHVLCWANKG